MPNLCNKMIPNKEIFVIYSPGRTGSHIITETLAGPPSTKGGLCNTIPYWDKEPNVNFDINTQSVIKTHNLDVITELNLNTNNVILILSKRRNVFEQAMSMLVAKITNEWTGKEYSNKNITPVTISKSIFINEWNRLTKWGDNIDSTQYKKVVTLWYEDIINQDNIPNYIASELGLRYSPNMLIKIYQKSPYQYKDCILNWQELKNLYDTVYINK
jgi:hypothetical protein